MPRSQGIALILIALVLGFVIGFKAGKAGGAATSAPAPAVAAEQPATRPGLPRLVDLGSTTCIPCKQMAPILEELKTELAGKVEVQFIDVTKNVAAADEYAINVIPTQIFLDRDGREVSRHEGFMARADILAQLKQMGVQVP